MHPRSQSNQRHRRGTGPLARIGYGRALLTSLLISHVTENIELFGLSNKVVWLFIQWFYIMLSFQSSFGTHFFKLQVVLCSSRDLVLVSSLTPTFNWSW